MNTFSVAMTCDVHEQLAAHLLRRDGQEDICIATYRLSTGTDRQTALLRRVVAPLDGERFVHENASITGGYVLRAAAEAQADGEGIVILHSHPASSGWQGMSALDVDAEHSYAHLASVLTGFPLVGMTLAGDGRWSARTWVDQQRPRLAESVRVIGAELAVTFNNDLRPIPRTGSSQERTVSAWGRRRQADLARLRVLVVGTGSVGLDVALRLVATGVEYVGVMDFDAVEAVNLDRLVGATRDDAEQGRSKVEVARRLMDLASTAEAPSIRTFDMSICEPDGLQVALGFDVIFSCVDRPWPRAVLNALAYTDLIPVIDGGIAIDAFADGAGMRNATWRTHVVRPGRPCLVCNGQLDLSAAQMDRQGLLDDPAYIAGAGIDHAPHRENVALLSASVSASMLAQFVSLTVTPGGRGEPGPLQYLLSTHTLETLEPLTRPHCAVENAVADGDMRLELTGRHESARTQIAARQEKATTATPLPHRRQDQQSPRRNRLRRLWNRLRAAAIN